MANDAQATGWLRHMATTEHHAPNPIVTHQFASLAAVEGLVHGVSTRAGGVSGEPYGSLNLGFHVGDEAAHVLENRRRFCAAVGVDADAVVAGDQVLGNAVAWVTEAHRGRGAAELETALPHTDALITDAVDVPLMAFSADCPLVLIVEPRRRAIGLAHASRRGTLEHVAERTVAAMVRLLDAEPAEMLAAIAPSIGPCCYEVGPDLAAAVRDTYADSADFLAERDGRHTLDLWAGNVSQLARAGIPPSHIELPSVCTRCHASRFFSHRASAGPTGRFGAVLALTGSADVA